MEEELTGCAIPSDQVVQGGLKMKVTCELRPEDGE